VRRERLLHQYSKSDHFPIIDVIISPPYEGDMFEPITVKALIDTGAYNTVIAREIVKKLNIRSEGKVPIITIGVVPIKHNNFIINFILGFSKFLTRKYARKHEISLQIGEKKIETTALSAFIDLKQSIQVIIGWDILNQLNFCCFGEAGTFCICQDRYCSVEHVNSGRNK
jgi:hypothetical protein